MQKYNYPQGSEEWYHVKKGKVTGTVLKGIMGTPRARQEAIYEIIAERLVTGVEMDYENPMERGNRLEPEAVAFFEFETGLKTERVGFCESDANHLIGNSPDRLIGETMALEIKCPLGKNYVKMWLTNEVPDEYTWQVIQYFIVNEKLEKLYFAAYHPDIPAHPMHIIEVLRSDVEKEIEQALSAQATFLLDVEKEMEKIVNI